MYPWKRSLSRGFQTTFVGATIVLGTLLGAVSVQAQSPLPQDEDHGRPVAQVAKELGVTPEQFRAAFRKVHPAGAGQQPTEAQRQANRKVLSESLGVSPERLDQVMDKYRPGGRGNNGPARGARDRAENRPQRPRARCNRPADM